MLKQVLKIPILQKRKLRSRTGARIVKDPCPPTHHRKISELSLVVPIRFAALRLLGLEALSTAPSGLRRAGTACEIPQRMGDTTGQGLGVELQLGLV